MADPGPGKKKMREPATGNPLMIDGSAHAARRDMTKGTTAGHIPERFAASYAVVGTKIYLFGGGINPMDGNPNANQKHMNDTWVLDTEESPHDRRWSLINATGVRPTPRRWHTMTTVGDQLYVYGGEHHRDQLSDMSVFDTKTLTWRAIRKDLSKAVPTARAAHSAVAVGHYIYVFGGFQTNTQFKSLFVFNTVKGKWKKIKTEGGPTARSNHSAVKVGRFIYVFGGYNAKHHRLMNDLWRFDTADQEWLRLHAGGHHPSGRANHTAVVLGRKMLVYGGRRENQRFHTDAWFYDFEKNTWSSTNKFYVVGQGRLVSCNGRLYSFGGSAYFAIPGKMRVFNPEGEDPRFLEKGWDNGSTSHGEFLELNPPAADDESFDQEPFPQEENRLMLSFKFAIVKEIGRNPFAVVYDCARKDDRQRVAVKIFNQYRPLNKIPREAKLLQMLQGHPYIQRYHSWYPIRYCQTFALVTQFHQEDDFKTEEEGLAGVRKYMYTFLQALGYVHQHSIVHRDIKAANVLWNASTKVATLIDFDVSYIHDPANPQNIYMGTPPYMSPELAQDGVAPEDRTGYDFGIDVWAAGLVFGQALFNHMHDVPTVEEIKQFERTDEFGYGKGPSKSSPAFDLMWEMIEPNLTARTTIKKALSHRFFHEERSEFSYSGGDEVDDEGKRVSTRGKSGASSRSRGGGREVSSSAAAAGVGSGRAAPDLNDSNPELLDTSDGPSFDFATAADTASFDPSGDTTAASLDTAASMDTTTSAAEGSDYSYYSYTGSGESGSLSGSLSAS